MNKEIQVKKLTPFKLWTLQNFPFIVEDFDALTNYEMMCKIVAKLNEVVDLTNEQTETFKVLEVEFNRLKEYVDSYLKGLEDVEKAIEIINGRLDELVILINKNTSDITNLSNRLNSEITRVIELIDQDYNLLKEYIDYNDNILNEKIDNIQIGIINIYDPTTGVVEPLQTVINNLYSLTNKDGLTASEFDNLNMTVTKFDSYQITAYQFDSSGKNILV